MTDPPVPKAGFDAGKARKPKPGELLIPEDFQLKHWIFGLLYVVSMPAVVLLAPGSGWILLPVIVGFLFVVEALRLLHRVVRLLSHARRPGNPTLLIVLLLIPVVKALVGAWLLPTVAGAVRADLRDAGIAADGRLLPLGVAAGLFSLIAVGSTGGVLPEEFLLLALAMDLGWILSWTAFIWVLQTEARRLSDLRHSSAGRAQVAAVFE